MSITDPELTDTVHRVSGEIVLAAKAGDVHTVQVKLGHLTCFALQCHAAGEEVENELTLIKRDLTRRDIMHGRQLQLIAAGQN
jgi:hypothetical protein